MKKLLVLSLSLFTVLALANCGQGNNPTSQPSSEQPSTSENVSSEDKSSEEVSSEAKKPYTHKVVGEKTATSHTVLFYVNLPDDNGLYRTYYVEDGQKIEAFRCVISGYYGSDWYYDQYGGHAFDFENTPITEDLELYGYPQSRKNNPGVTEYEEETKEYTISWKPGNNTSFVHEDAGILPLSANANEKVSFKVAYALNTKKDAEVKVNDEIITADANGVYSFVVTENVTVTTSDVKVYNPNDKYDYYLYINSTKHDMVINPNNQSEYMVEGVMLNVGDTFYVEKTDGTTTLKYDDRLTGNGTEKFVCSEAGEYGFYFNYNIGGTWIAGPLKTFTFTDVPSDMIANGNRVFAWAWPTGGEGSWIEANVDVTNSTLTLKMDATLTNILFTVYSASDNTAPNWDSKLSQTADLALPAGTTTISFNDLGAGGNGGGGGSTTPSPDAPTTGYALVINGTTYVPLTHNPNYTGDGEEWFAKGVTINAGDVVTMYNGDAGEGWVIQTPDSWSTGSWTGGPNGITCNQSGTFDVYCKMIYQNDNIYFGAAA